MSSQARKSAFVKMLIQLEPFDGEAVRLEYSSNITRLAKKLARHMDR
jgi:hypothetical protein